MPLTSPSHRKEISAARAMQCIDSSRKAEPSSSELILEMLAWLAAARVEGGEVGWGGREELLWFGNRRLALATIGP